MGWDHRKLLSRVVESLADLDADRSPWERVCHGLAEDLEAEFGGVFEVEWPHGRATQKAAWPAWAAAITLTPDATLAHPLVRHYALYADPEPRTLSEVVDARRWADSPRYAAARAAFAGVYRHIALPLSSTRRTVRLVGLGRSGAELRVPFVARRDDPP